MPTDPYNLTRFVQAQAGTYDQAHRELTRGRKQSHWMWFIFPQMQGLGASSMAQRYALSGLAEATAYLAHPLLGPRLRDCTRLVNQAYPTPLETVFGYPDDLKFHSSITLFDQAEPQTIFSEALKLWFQARPDQPTLSKLETTKLKTKNS